MEVEGTSGGVELRTPGELPSSEASAVAAALERWGRVRCRVDALRPVLEHEDRLMQEILALGLGGEDRRTLRKLVSGGGSDAEEEARRVADSIGGKSKHLQEILMRSQRELLELSTSASPDYKKELLAEMDAVLEELRRAQDAVLGELFAAKERTDTVAVRVAGRSLNDLKALTRRLDGERHSLTKNSALAALLVTVCRRVLPVRHVDPNDLLEILPSHEGYLQILDFYFFSDASSYCFGEHFSGPNWFTRLKRNIAILMIHDETGKRLYNAFAVSGVHNTPGAPIAPESGPLESIQAEDEHGRVFDRRHDAEFKLLTDFCALVGDADAAATCKARASLWSKKPLCRSCAGAVLQVQRRFPHLQLEVVVGDPSATEPKGRQMGGLSPSESNRTSTSSAPPCNLADVASAPRVAASTVPAEPQVQEVGESACRVGAATIPAVPQATSVPPTRTADVAALPTIDGMVAMSSVIVGNVVDTVQKDSW